MKRAVRRYDRLMSADLASSRDLTTKAFWEEIYLAPIDLPARPSVEVPFERCLMRAFDCHAPVRPGQRLLEIGCAPGRWLVFFAERFGAAVEGLEYTELGARQTEENLRVCHVHGTVHHADFWSFEPDAAYDFVLSLGFIEHFDDVDAAFARHVPFIAPGGRLVLTVPNFQGLNVMLQRWCDPDWLALHNRDAMGHAGYVRRAAANGLEVERTCYVGGFDPDIISVRRRGRRLIAPFWHLRHHGVGDHVNGPWLSSFLLMVFERPRLTG